MVANETRIGQTPVEPPLAPAQLVKTLVLQQKATEK